MARISKPVIIIILTAQAAQRIAIAVVVGVVIGALAMHFLSSLERWIRL